MSLLDLNNSEQMRQSMPGPLPRGSRALLRITLERSNFPVEGNPRLGRSQNGLIQLPVRLEVASGSYAGYHWYERITVPENLQTLKNLDEKQVKACRVGGSILRGILESSQRIRPGDESEEAMRKRRIDSWEQFAGLLFPAKLGIDMKPVIRNGKIYWRNCIAFVLPVTDSDYESIMAGGEYISKGPVTGEKGRD